jgi:phospholipase C
LPTNPPPGSVICGLARRYHAYVDHTVTDQASILRFIEDNWLNGQRITGSFDNLAGRLNTMFDFKSPDTTQYILNSSTGLVVK